MKKITAVFVIFAIAACVFTACAKKPQGIEHVTVQGGDTLDLVTKEGGGLDRDEDNNIIVVVTDDNGKAVTEKGGEQVTSALDLKTALVYDNRIEFNNYYIDIPKGWSDSSSYNTTSIKKNNSDDAIEIMRYEDSAFEKKYSDIKQFYSASCGMYPDAVTEDKGIKIGDMDCTRYELFIPKTSNDKPLYTCYVLIERDDALYSVMITATRDLREDFGEAEKILNSIQFK